MTERKQAEVEARDSERRYRENAVQLAHANRVATMGQLTASIAHEVNQPIAATVTNAQAALRWLGAKPPKSRRAPSNARPHRQRRQPRPAPSSAGIRNLIKKKSPGDERVDVNAAIREVIELTRSEAITNQSPGANKDLAEGLPPVRGDPVGAAGQEVILNLIVNALEAVSGMGQGSRESQISAGKSEPADVLVAVRDSGPGLDPDAMEHLFKAFYTTKPNGLGMGLSICRSIVEAHGGRMWASANSLAAPFEFTLPFKLDDASP